MPDAALTTFANDGEKGDTKTLANSEAETPANCGARYLSVPP